MIRRGGTRRATELTLVPTYKADPLPAWTPSAPRGGWTPSSAWDAALDYAAEHEDDDKPARLLAASAYVALLGGIPGLHRADVIARLNGNHPRAEYMR